MIHCYGEVKKEQHNYPKAIKELREILEQEQPELEQYFLELWDKQQKEITAQQYIEIVKKGKLTKEIEKQLLQSTSIFVLGKMLDKRQTVMEKGAKEVKKPLFLFDIKYHETKKWLTKSCAEQIVQLTKTQKEAIKLVIDRAEKLGITADGTADLLKPLIGLHKGQVVANVNYYNSIKQNLLENHPKMKEQTAEQKALEKAKQYAKRQKEQRAMNIARTELAGAYNAGEFYGIKQAQKDGLMGKVIKYAISAGDSRTCKGCREVEGQEVKQDDYFETQWGKVLFPPFHVDCRCAVEYEETSEAEEMTPNIPNTIEIPRNGYDESDGFFGNMRRNAKGVVAGGKVVPYDKLPKNMRESFEQGLKNAVPMTKIILQREMKNVDYIVKEGKNLHDFHDSFFNYIQLRKDAPISTLAHELFHRIDVLYDVTKEYDFRKVIQKDFDNLLMKCVKDGSVEAYLLRKYPYMFKQTKISEKLEMLEKYRGISDIFSGVTNDKLRFGYGHNYEEYWKKDRKNLSKEAWAQYGRITYSNDKEVIKVFQELFPNFYEYAIMALKELM